MTTSLPNISRSLEIYESGNSRIPGVTQTFAKGPRNYVFGVSPIFAESGKGAYLTDVDGNTFLDFTMAVGPLSLGYSDPRVNQAIQNQLDKGITFSLPSSLETVTAEKIIEMVPGIESVRFSKTGADVTTAAIRLARAITGRDEVVCCGYHGWHDWYIGLTSRNSGIPDSARKLTRNATYNDIESFRALMNEKTACVILEPVLFEAPQADFLRQLRQLCDQVGCLLIFDEMWTGFRIDPGGAQKFFDVRADLVTFSKSLANGMPLSVICGSYAHLERFEKDVFFYTTFGGEALSLAAAMETLTIIQSEDVCGHIGRLGLKLKEGINQLSQTLHLPHIQCMGLPFRTLLNFSSEDSLLEKSFVSQELLRNRILWSGNHHLSFSHTEADIDTFLDALAPILTKLRELKTNGKLASALLGKPIQVPFRTTTGKTHLREK